MKSTRQKQYRRDSIKETFKIIGISLLVVGAIIGLCVAAVKGCKKCEEDKRIEDSILRADSIREADSLTLVKMVDSSEMYEYTVKATVVGDTIYIKP